MDKKYQDIHYRYNGNDEDVFVYREVTIHNLKFRENSIEITFTEWEFPITPTSSCIKTIIIPILPKYSLIID